MPDIPVSQLMTSQMPVEPKAPSTEPRKKGRSRV